MFPVPSSVRLSAQLMSEAVHGQSMFPVPSSVRPSAQLMSEPMPTMSKPMPRRPVNTLDKMAAILQMPFSKVS